MLHAQSGPGTLTPGPSPINLTARIKNPPTCVEADNEPFTQRRVVIYRGLTQQGAVTADDVRAETRRGFSFINAINHDATCHASVPRRRPTRILLAEAAAHTLMSY